jgi:hypothetical protein
MEALFRGLTAAAALTVCVAAAQNAPATQGGANTTAAPIVPHENSGAIRVSQTATKPEKGANSFTADQAKARIESKGFQNVTDLHKDDDGVWHGRAQKDGQQVGVWLDYKGNVGTSSS